MGNHFERLKASISGMEIGKSLGLFTEMGIYSLWESHVQLTLLNTSGTCS